MKGKITGHLLNVRKSGGLEKPSLSVHATVMAPMRGEGPDSKKYERDRLAQLNKEIAAIEKRLKNWDHEEVGKLAEKSLRTELAVKRARREECKARLAGDDSSSGLASAY